jgi:hypothetical protein
MGRTRVDPAAVAALVAALRESPLERPRTDNLGFTREWLSAKTESPEVKTYERGATPEQRALYRRSLADPDVVEKVVPTLFDYVIHDAYFYARIAATFSFRRACFSTSTAIGSWPAQSGRPETPWAFSVVAIPW